MCKRFGELTISWPDCNRYINQQKEYQVELAFTNKLLQPNRRKDEHGTYYFVQFNAYKTGCSSGNLENEAANDVVSAAVTSAGVESGAEESDYEQADTGERWHC